MIDFTPPMTHFVQFNLSDMIAALGEDDVKNILSSFVCPKNKDVDNFKHLEKESWMETKRTLKENI